MHGQAFFIERELFLLHVVAGPKIFITVLFIFGVVGLFDVYAGEIWCKHCAAFHWGCGPLRRLCWCNLVHSSGTVCVQASAGQPGENFCAATFFSWTKNSVVALGGRLGDLA